MSSKLIITIGREFGAEGHEIGKELADRIGFTLYDKDMLAIAAQKSGIDINVLAHEDESYSGHALSPYLTIGRLSKSMGDKLFRLQTDIIHDLAAKGSCIIVGRLGDYILKDNPNCLKAFIYAPFEKRVEIIKNKHGISEGEAKKLVRRWIPPEESITPTIPTASGTERKERTFSSTVPLSESKAV